METKMTPKDGAQQKTIFCFFCFGMLTMVYDEMSLTAAQDVLAGTEIATTTVILSIAVPVLVVKSTVPWFMQRLSYTFKIVAITCILLCGLVTLVSVSAVIGRLLGVGIIEAGVATSEITIMSLTAFYNEVAVSAFVAGIGTASLFGPFYYTGLTTWIDLSPRTTIMSTIPWPLFMVVLYAVLNKDPLKEGTRMRKEETEGSLDKAHYFDGATEQRLDSEGNPEKGRYSDSAREQGLDSKGSPEKGRYSDGTREQRLDSVGALPTENETEKDKTSERKIREKKVNFKTDDQTNRTSPGEFTIVDKLSVAVDIFPYIFFLFATYFSEYISNHAVITTLAFPSSPFSPRDHYPYYLLVYHIGKFLGRSHIFFVTFLVPKLLPCILVKKTWKLALIASAHFVFFVLLSWYRFIPHVSVVLVLCFTEGFTAGSIYVNSIHAVSDGIVDTKRREFALGLLTIGNATGKLVAGFAGLWQEPLLRKHCIEDLKMGDYCFTRHSNEAEWEE